MAPLATGETLKKQKYKDLSTTTGLFEYIKEAISVLKDGGIVMMSPQTTREISLSDVPQSRPLASLLIKTSRLENGIAIMFVGIGIKGVVDYTSPKIRGFNLGKTYEVTVGSSYTKEEAQEKAGGIKQVDAWAFSELAKVVPESYLAK